MMGLVLASRSATRRVMLEQAGFAFIVDSPDVDEASLKGDCQAAALTTAETAEALALMKALVASRRHAGDIVIGADQMLECDGAWFDKPSSRTAAGDQLALLSGKTHRLISAVVAVRDGVEIWKAVDSAELTMRDLSPEAIESYLDRAGERVFGSVGGYQVEGIGIQLFSAIRGDHFTILGLPLLPLLSFLRAEGLLP
jgi:septum formation protein